MSGPSARQSVALSLILAAACWGVGTAISKRAVAEIPSLTLLPIQLGVSLIVLVVLIRLRGEHLSIGSGPSILARLGLLNPGLAYSLSLLGLVRVTASLSVLLWAVEPLMILLLAALFLRERIGLVLVCLSAVAVAGLGLVIGDGAFGGYLPGVLLTLAGVACCATYSVVTRRFLGATDSTMQVVVHQQTYALALALVVLAVGAFLGLHVWPRGLTVVGAASVVASGFVYYGFAYCFYLSGLRQVSASVAAVSFYLIPVFGIAGGSVLGERLDARQWLGAGIVILAVSLVAQRTSALAADP